jgi:hypothetical protein
MMLQMLSTVVVVGVELKWGIVRRLLNRLIELDIVELHTHLIATGMRQVTTGTQQLSPYAV